MRVVVWNMGHKVASWRVLEELAADIALLSEARVPKGELEGNVLGGRKTDDRAPPPLRHPVSGR
jgi:hypothetical protein